MLLSPLICDQRPSVPVCVCLPADMKNEAHLLYLGWMNRKTKSHTNLSFLKITVDKKHSSGKQTQPPTNSVVTSALVSRSKCCKNKCHVQFFDMIKLNTVLCITYWPAALDTRFSCTTVLALLLSLAWFVCIIHLQEPIMCQLQTSLEEKD